ncbi:MAG: aminotransferase class I/II-fold pyridoxal phosphate-dependent enzyme [Lepagella sp.]
MFPITPQQLDDAIRACGVGLLTEATIRQMCSVAAQAEGIAGEKMVHLEIGNPGLPASQVGVEAEKAALDAGVANQYPNIGGIPELKKAGERFIKAFLGVDVPAEGIIPTVGSMQGSFTLMLLLGQRDPKKDTMLFLNPGFPAQPTQAYILGLKQASFDIYDYRGAKLEAKLEEMMAGGNITAMVYSSPNNPAWTNLTDEELQIIARVSKKHDVIVMEDLAYMGMDFRHDYSHPGQAPYVPTVARYCDNYILLLSGSKIFSYAGQRIAMVCMSPAVANREFPALTDFYHMPTFLKAYIFGVLYAASSGTSHSAQCALAAMLDAAADGKLDFVGDSREYGRRGERTKKIFTDNGFEIVYAKDGKEPIGDGFFFTAGYPGMDSETVQRELLRHGVSAISLPGTGSRQHGIRVCVSMISDDKAFDDLDRRLKAFNAEHHK